MHTADTPQSKKNYTCTVANVDDDDDNYDDVYEDDLFFPGGPRSTLCVGGSPPLSCGSTCLWHSS